jgi:hypothetical protein
MRREKVNTQKVLDRNNTEQKSMEKKTKYKITIKKTKTAKCQ